ncbi:MAG: hypothetical protein MI976_12700 [Pseudomonadales bacterium]|nr:hypothetical protein [Pseudomonadales bacterium]
MTSIEEKIKNIGGVLKTDNESNNYIAFGKVQIQQATLEQLHNIQCIDINGLVFYYCDFKTSDFSVLNNLKIEHISILHGNFSDNELSQLSLLPNLKTVKLHDTKVSEKQIKLIENGSYAFSFK